MKTTTGTDPNDFTEVWHQTEASNEWRFIFVDISEYKGNDIYVAFRHQGIDSDRNVKVGDLPTGLYLIRCGENMMKYVKK